MSSFPPPTTANQTCLHRINEHLFFHLFLVPAVVIITALSYLQRRDHRLSLDDTLPCLKGHFGIVVPLDTMGSHSNRWSYGFAFGAISSSVLMLFTNGYLPFDLPLWARAFVYLVGALEMGLIYFPIFACLSTPARGVGAVLGILYTLTWLIVNLWQLFDCPYDETFGQHRMLIFWPSILCLVFLLGRFLAQLVKAIRIHLHLQHQDPGEMIKPQVQHVKRLLRRPESSFEQSWFQRRVYNWDPHFKFPNRIIGTAIVSLICLYTMILLVHIWGEALLTVMEGFVTTPEEGSTSNPNHETLVAILKDFINMTRKSTLVASACASLTSVNYVFHVLVCYRKHIKRLWAGQRDFLPERLHHVNPAVSLECLPRENTE